MVQCLESLLRNTPPNIPILFIDDASPDSRITEYLQPKAFKGNFAFISKPTNSGFVGTANLAFALCAPHDVVLLNSDILVPANWLERLTAAVYSSASVATATPFTNHGSILSVPVRNTPSHELIPNLSFEEYDHNISQYSRRLYPIIPTAIGHCVYFKRTVLELVGYFDEAFAPGYGEEVDFSQRAVLSGFNHVVADDLFVYHKGSVSFGENPAKAQLQSAHEAIINQRYPWYLGWVGENMTSIDTPFGEAYQMAQAAVLGFQIAIDATCLDGKTNGTQVGTLELIRAMASIPALPAQLTLIVNDNLPLGALSGVEKLVKQVITVSEAEKLPLYSFDLVHRPFQVYALEDLERLQHLSTRFIVAHLDSLSYSNPSYADSPEWWVKLRYFTQLTFASAAGIIFNSHTTRQEAAQQGLTVSEERSCVTYVGVDHILQTSTSKPPLQAETLREQPFILVLGANFKHKNRPYALRLLGELLQQYEWQGRLVFAGYERGNGGSGAEEAAEIARNPELAKHLINLGGLAEEEKSWLIKHAALVLYPSSVEGFGIIPFEAALSGTPALFSRSSSLGEILGNIPLYLENFNPTDGAALAWRLLSEPNTASQQVNAIVQQASHFTWAKIAAETWKFYRQILNLPLRANPNERLRVELQNLQREYVSLQEWSTELNNKLVTLENNPSYKIISRLRRFRP
jgi:GT2 family glycosyltransferase